MSQRDMELAQNYEQELREKNVGISYSSRSTKHPKEKGNQINPKIHDQFLTLAIQRNLDE